MQNLSKALFAKIEEKQIAEAKKKMRDEASIWFERGLVEENKNGCNKSSLEYYRKAV
jgi:hypothetical protein